MKDNYILSIDIGTTGLKYGIYDEHGKNIIFLRKNTPLVKKEYGTLDTEEIYISVIKGIEEIVRESQIGKNIQVIGIDGQMGGILGVDELWRPVFNFDPPINNNYKPYMNKLIHNYGELISNISGSVPINGAKIQYWKNEHEKDFKKIEKIMSLAGYVTSRLAGLKSQEAFIDHTSTYLYALGTYEKWSEVLCDTFGIPISKLPNIYPSTKIVGFVNNEVSSQCGIPSGIPLIAGSGDTASSILGAGIVSPGSYIDIAGTCSVFGICTDRQFTDTKSHSLIRMRAPLGDINYLLGVGFGGELHSWFLQNIIYDKQGDRFQEIKMESEKISAGSNGLLFFPFLGGSFIPPDEKLRGTWFGLNWEHTAAHMYRSILESIGYEYYCYRDVFQQGVGDFENRPVVVTGSGKKNELWNIIKANILQSDYIILNRDDHENLGTALVAAKGINLIDNVESVLKNCIDTEKTITRKKVKTDMYAEKARQYMEYKNNILNKIYQNYNYS